jgi:hypothetical protein
MSLSHPCGIVGKSDPGTLPALLTIACLTNPRVRIGRGPVRAQRPDPVSFKFANFNPARFLHYSQLRVSPVRVCGLGGVRLRSTTGPCFFVTQTESRNCGSVPSGLPRNCGFLGNQISAGRQACRTSTPNHKSPHFADIHCRKQGGLAEALPRRPASDRTLGGTGNRVLTSRGRRPTWSSRTC